jgi:hypothetical protein
LIFLQLCYQTTERKNEQNKWRVEKKRRGRRMRRRKKRKDKKTEMRPIQAKIYCNHCSVFDALHILATALHLTHIAFPNTLDCSFVITMRKRRTRPVFLRPNLRLSIHGPPGSVDRFQGVREAGWEKNYNFIFTKF